MKKSKHDIQLEAVKAILSGELLLEEAMQKFNVKDKRTMVAWVQKMKPIMEMSAEIPDPIKKMMSDQLVGLSSIDNTTVVSSHEHLRTENVLLKKVVFMQDKIRELEEVNGRLLIDRKFLSEKVTRLELKLQLSESD